MSVLQGEGKYPILFGSTSIPGASRVRRGYLARPNLTGEWPSVVLVPSIFGISPSIKDVCRRLARQGLAVVSLDLYDGGGPERGAAAEDFLTATSELNEQMVLNGLLDVVAFISNPAGFWSSAEHGFGVLAVGGGVRFAAPLAEVTQPEGLGLVYASQTVMVNSRLAAYGGPILGIWGADDEVADLDAARRLREEHRRTEVVIYGDVDHAFLDDSHDDFDEAAAGDAIDRLSVFFLKHLPPPPAG